MRTMIAGLAILVSIGGAMPVAASQAGFEDEVLRRLDRLERRIDMLERDLDRERDRSRESYSRPAPRPAPREEVVAAVNLLCGANCGIPVAGYCRSAGFARGVAVTIEKRNGFDHVTRARCFN